MLRTISKINIMASEQLLNFLAALYIAIFLNLTFNKNVYSAFFYNADGPLHVITIIIVNTAVIYLFLSLFAIGRIQKHILFFVITLSSALAYFIDEFGVVIDNNIIMSMLNTDKGELSDLITLKLFFYFFALGVLPATLIFIAKKEVQTASQRFLSFIKNSAICLALIVGLIFSFSQFFSSFFREHKAIRYYSNPSFAIYSLIKYSTQNTHTETTIVSQLDENARIPSSDVHRELVIFVLGETARSDHFSLNGYSKPTNPQLSKEDVISFSNFYSCGTSTAVSVPCLFSHLGRQKYSKSEAKSYENLLDILSGTNDVDILWRDNNSDSKGVALRVPYESFKSADRNKRCDTECRDIGMLDGLQDFINKSKKKDILVVLHQMGNHGPAYFKRYPKSFDKFKPSCQSQELSNCSNEEIHNAYDNAILYTDHFLAKTIKLLKTNDEIFETTMIYVSDHGESLGENGIYLHGLPYSVAPDEQKKVAAIFWFGKGMRDDINIEAIKGKKDHYFSHDNIFHTVIGLFELESDIYKQNLDIFK